MPENQVYDFVVLGGGIAGLTFAREASRRGKLVLVLESEEGVGGLSRTFRFGDYRFDIGGHRLVSPWPEVIGWVSDVLDGDILEVRRVSHILLGSRFITYPLELPNALTAFSPLRAIHILASYVKASASRRPDRADSSFEEWVVSRFGRALYEVYFRPYTEKVWGVPCSMLAADHAVQRIKLPSLTAAVKGSLLHRAAKHGTLVSRFYYPPLGFGVIPDRLAEQAEVTGRAVIHTQSRVTRLHFSEPAQTWHVDAGIHGTETSITARQVISTIPVQSLLGVLPELDPSTRAAADELHYRGLMCVFLALDGPRISADTWTYFPADDVCFGRTHEPGNWSVRMTPDGATSLVAEVFCSPGDETWTRADDEIIAGVERDLLRLGWLRPGQIRDAWLLRVAHAYPIYRLGYHDRLRQVHEALARWPSLHLAGRTGSFRYLNADDVIKRTLHLVDELVGTA